jgi:hypothetical protein
MKSGKTTHARPLWAELGEIVALEGAVGVLDRATGALSVFDVPALTVKALGGGLGEVLAGGVACVAVGVVSWPGGNGLVNFYEVETLRLLDRVPLRQVKGAEFTIVVSPALDRFACVGAEGVVEVVPLVVSRSAVDQALGRAESALRGGWSGRRPVDAR